MTKASSISRVKTITPESAHGELQQIYQNLEKKLGKVPNIFQIMGNSPAALKAFLGFNEAVSHFHLSPTLREQIALTVSQANHCQYCLSAHSAIGKNLGMGEQEILDARQTKSRDKKTQAILTFSKEVVQKQGHISTDALHHLLEAGVTESELVEIILVINLTMLTNYFNHITDPKVDFPTVKEL